MTEHFDTLSAAPKRPLKVFLCHASADKPKVRELYRTLKRRGVQPWLDAEDLIPGQNWEVEIPKAILSSDAIIICLTPNSVDKEGYVQKEIKFALDKAMEMPEGRIFLIPAKLEECDLPFSLKQYQAVNLYEKDGYTKLMKALKVRASQLERVTVELPKSREITTEFKKVVEEKKPPELKRDKPENKDAETPVKSLDKGVDVGDDASGNLIVTGSSNVINIGNLENLVPVASKSEKLQPKKTKAPRKPNTAIIVALIGLSGTIIAALLGLPSIQKWLSPAPVSTELATATITLTSQSIIPPKTIEPSWTPTEFITPSSTSTKAFTPAPTLDIGSTMISEKDGMVMVYVPESSFIMGDDNGYSHEKPAHNVFLDAFWIDRTEVSNGQYVNCVNAGVCAPPVYRGFYDVFDSKYIDYPIVDVTWHDANSYCEWVNRRLPTEAEWEKAARGIDGRTYPWGNGDLSCQFANALECVPWSREAFYNLAPVGSYPNGASPYGALDMIGNVWEWVEDWYDETYYAQSPEANPHGPLTGKYRLLRGGSSYDNARAVTRL